MTKAAIDRVRALHANEHGCCAHCTRADAVLFPCPTIEALDEPRDQDHDDDAMPFIADVTSRAYACSDCGRDGTVLEATFTVTTKRAVHQVGTFAFCFACEGTQEAARG
ncbi:hypothetical protein [Streptomyces europaeiscabiei]|uniref:hypothetical protein n=1 Tax=Streptomyces europaeiscabiei TaxID=146819 RepID=UPI002E11A2B7|nr:hypothetical protein OHB30_33320 [Streptomyces europaeiscabiei]